MKEMIYSATRLNPPEMLADGEYKGFHFYVLNLGTHPCAYVDVTDTNLHGEHYSGIDIECHCGLTYSREYLNTVDKKGWFIGWDYAHYCDFTGYELEMPIDIKTNGKKWTTAEIVNECKQVIDQIVTDTNVGSKTEKGDVDEANKNLLKPQNMTDEECSSLWVYTDGQQCISCWKMSFKQRLSALIHGKVWLSVCSGQTQPPVWVDCCKTVFDHPTEKGGAE